MTVTKTARVSEDVHKGVKKFVEGKPIDGQTVYRAAWFAFEELPAPTQADYINRAQGLKPKNRPRVGRGNRRLSPAA